MCLPSASSLGLCVAVCGFVFSSLKMLVKHWWEGKLAKKYFALALLKSKTKAKGFLKNVFVSKL